jgi:serine/threonine-protein kinase
MSDNSESRGELTGKTLGQYEIRGQIGQGGMATVYLGYQPAIERTVAIKVMPKYFMHDPNFLQRFQREVKLIARLQHPRIVPVYDYGQVEGQPYIVMAYMPSGTLADRMAQGALPLDETVRLIEQIAEGLDHAHREGVIHRDFKPSNVLLDKAGNVHLADFGIAKISESTAALTGSGMVGTPSYMAPESASGGSVSSAVDIYALGVTSEMLAGRRPYEGDTAIRVMMSHMNDPIPDIRAARPDLPPGIDIVIQRAMAKDPAQRYSSAGEMVRALRAAASGVTDTAPRRTAGYEQTVVETPLAAYGTGTAVPGPTTPTPYQPPSAPVDAPARW